ncbi:MAG: hypothetical protein E7679_00845 [Ruminococcaceae bacterium]|nr:hypothetical protein [Oscillospiraceae bacterium]
MELWEEMLYCTLNRKLKIRISKSLKLEELLEKECYKALKKIKEIIEDDSLSDKECFMQIEEIVCVFERLGSGGGGRHDFG